MWPRMRAVAAYLIGWVSLFGAGVGVLASVAASASAPAAAPASVSASRWSTEPTAAPPGARADVLSAVSCPSPTACTAVGYATSPDGDGSTLSERRTGSRWSIEPTPALPGSRTSLLFAVSCPSATACTAVGSVTSRSGRTRPLAERWNGTRWSSQRVPASSGSVSYLAAVSCASRTVCVAVGYAGNRSGSRGAALAERWDGHRWAIERAVRPAGARVSFLSGVSCTGWRACAAVGFSNDVDGTQAPLAERWDGRVWSVEPMTRVAGQPNAQLAGVACAGEQSCTAVGFFTNVTGIDVMLAEHWNGTRWAQQNPGYPSGARSVQFSGVSCTSSGSCTAVGVFSDPEGSDAMLAERSNGGRWTIERTPTVTGSMSASLGAVSCSSATTCTAVGNSTNRAGAARALAVRSSL
jgi:hypothetical protein